MPLKGKKTSTSRTPEVAVATCDLFDPKRVRQLSEMMNELSMTEIDIRHGASRILLRRGGAVAHTVVASAAPVPQQHAIAPTAVSAPAASAVPAADDAAIAIIKSPMVGTFYASPKPDAPSYVKVGDSIGAEKTVCLIEAMKVYNEIQAEVSGKIVAVLVKNGDAVDVNKPLFKVDTRG
ncbi:MAG: acetyl-CoA carboxylase biotin carboxyl carrier protein [Thermoguttaceae bacterium]